MNSVGIVANCMYQPIRRLEKLYLFITLYSIVCYNDKSVENVFFFPGNCTDCSTEHGKCVKGFCECEDGWEGASCEQKGESYVGNGH